MKKALILWLIPAFSMVLSAYAGDRNAAATPEKTTSAFDDLKMEFQPMAGLLYSFGPGSSHTTLNYAIGSVRLGVIPVETRTGTPNQE